MRAQVGWMVLVQVEACDQGHNFAVCGSWLSKPSRWQLLNTVVPCSPLSSAALTRVSPTARRVCFQALKILAVIVVRTTMKEWMEPIVRRTPRERRRPLRNRHRWVGGSLHGLSCVFAPPSSRGSLWDGRLTPGLGIDRVSRGRVHC